METEPQREPVKQYRFRLPIRTEEDLRAFIQHAWGLVLPDTVVCPGHSTPWRAFAEAYFARSPVTVWKGSRGFGGKTHTLAGLAQTEAVTLGADVSLLGGSGAQSTRVLESMTKLWNHPWAPRGMLKSDPALHHTVFRDGNKVIALMASQASVRGPHPQRLRMDEVDEMDIRILNSALGQTMSDRGIKPQIVLSSTHQYGDQTMTEVLRRARESQWPVHEWSLAEGTNVLTAEGERRIEDVRMNDLVLTRSGWRPVQHVSRMGFRPTLNLRLSNGRTLSATHDHLFAANGGWVRAEDLYPGAALEGFRVEGHASPAVSPPIAGGHIGVLRGVLMPTRAMRPCDLCPDPRGAEHVDAVGDVLDVVATRADAPARAADVIQFSRDRGALVPDAPGEAVSHALAPRVPLDADETVAVLVDAEQPDPAAGDGVDSHARQDVGGVGGDLRDHAVPPVRTAAAETQQAGRPGLPAAIPAKLTVHVRRITRGLTVPVWDIGVHGDHEFVADGVVVHNCYRETLQPHGWLSMEDVVGKRLTVPKAMWDNEYELQEPSPESRVFDAGALERMFMRALGEFRGDPSERIELEKPDPKGLYATGADWAKKQDWTVIVTYRYDLRPLKLVAYERMGRLPWPQMVAAFNERLDRYPGVAAHDATGIGDVVAGYLTHRVDDLILAGRTRSDLLSEYINAVERDEIRAPWIGHMESEHRLASVDDVFGSGHLPDSIAAAAIAYRAAGLGFSPRVW